jgi:hypothetical protein
MAWFLTGAGKRCRRLVGSFGGGPGHFKACRVELADQAADALLSPRLDDLGTGADTQRL